MHASLAVERAGVDVGEIDLSGVTLRPMPWWMRAALGSSISGITLRRSVFIAVDQFSAVVEGRRPGLLVHEITHVEQWRREGSTSFLLRYLSEYVRNRVIGLDHFTAYRAISYEADAFDAQRWSVGADAT